MFEILEFFIARDYKKDANTLLDMIILKYEGRLSEIYTQNNEIFDFLIGGIDVS